MAGIKLEDILLNNKSLMECNPDLVKEFQVNNSEDERDFSRDKDIKKEYKELEKKYKALKKVCIEASIEYWRGNLGTLEKHIKKMNTLIKKDEYL